MTNIYFGLQTGNLSPSHTISLWYRQVLRVTGWVSMMSLQSALLGFALFRLLPRILPSLVSKPFTPQENVILQTTAVATGTMPLAAGLVGIIPALEMMTPKEDGREGIRLGFWQLVLWCLAVAFFGQVDEYPKRSQLITSVFLAAPLRRQVIVKEKLVFPSGSESRSWFPDSSSPRQLRRHNLSLFCIKSLFLLTV